MIYIQILKVDDETINSIKYNKETKWFSSDRYQSGLGQNIWRGFGLDTSPNLTYTWPTTHAIIYGAVS